MISHREQANSTMLDHAATRAPITPGKIIVWGALGFLLYIAHAAFIPIVLALLFALVLSGPVEALHKLHIPRSVSASLILVLVLAAMAGGVELMWNPAQEWLAKAPQTMTIVKHKIIPVARFMNHLDDLRNNAANLGSQNRTTPGTESAARVSGDSARVWIFGATTGAIAGVLTFVIVTLFLLAGGPPMLARMTAAFVDNLNASHVLHMIEAVRAEVGRFYVTTTLINMGFGLATAVAMMAWGMPTPYLWGALAAGLNYIPYAGSATTLIVLTLVAVVSFNTLGHVLGVSGTYVLLAAIEGQVMQPLLVGRRLELNPLLVFLGLWFGGLFWGIAGIVLATPALVALKVIAENAMSGKAMMQFLGPNDPTWNRDGKLRRFADFPRFERRGTNATFTSLVLPEAAGRIPFLPPRNTRTSVAPTPRDRAP
jgi:predicted PurR-regulated permease PerM